MYYNKIHKNKNNFTFTLYSFIIQNEHEFEKIPNSSLFYYFPSYKKKYIRVEIFTYRL